MSETGEHIQILRDPEIPKTPVYSIEVATDPGFYKTEAAPLRLSDNRRESGQKSETRLSHIDAHRRDFRRLGAKSAEEALPYLGKIVSSSDTDRVRHFVEEKKDPSNRVLVWDTQTQMLIVVQTEKYKNNDKTPPPAYVVTAFRCHPREVEDRLQGLGGPKWIAEPIKEEAYA